MTDSTPSPTTEPTPFQQTYLNLSAGPIGRLVVLRSGNPGPGLGLGVENVRATGLDIGHFLAIPTADGQVAFAVTLTPDVRSDLDVNELVFEQDGEAEFQPPMTARPLTRVWTLGILGNTAGTARPAPFAPLYFASREGVDFALGQHRIPDRQRLPIGVVANGDGQIHPVYLHAEYLLGPQGVHANWGGVSGLSGKTSKKSLCEMAILALRQRFGLRCALVVFATKGTDELFRDLPADPLHPFWQTRHAQRASLSDNDWLTADLADPLSDLALYAALGLTPEPFANLRLYVPQGDHQWWGYRTPDTNGDLGTADILGFQWSLRQIASYMHLFASTDVDDKLKAMEAEVLRVMRDGYWAATEDPPERRTLNTLADLEQFFEYAMDNVDNHRRWQGHHIETIARARARYLSIFQRASQVVSAEAVSAKEGLPLTELQDGSLWVLDLSRLKEEAKVLVIYKVISELYDLMQANRLPLDRLLLDVDELNQHAPRRQTGAASRLLTSRLQDLAERARTDGIILLTAQQTLSDVDERIEANLATRFYGVMGLQEAQHNIYGFTDLEKYLVTRLESGEMLVQHPMLRHRVKVRVPRAVFLRGKAGQALLNPATEPDLAERLQRLLAGHAGRAVPPLAPIQAIIQTCLEQGVLVSELEATARQVSDIHPLEDQRNTGRATLKLWALKIKGMLGVEVGID